MNIWRDMVNQSCQLQNGNGKHQTPLEQLLEMTEKILVQMGIILGSCLEEDQDEQGMEDTKCIKVPTLVAKGLDLKSKDNKRILKDVENIPLEFKKFVQFAPEDKTNAGEKEDSEIQLGFQIENQLFKILVGRIVNDQGFPKHVLLKRIDDKTEEQSRPKSMASTYKSKKKWVPKKEKIEFEEGNASQNDDDYMFSKKSRYKKHINETIQNFDCLFCDSVFSSKFKLIRHEQSHAGPFQCKECGNSLANRMTYKKHMNNLHSKFEVICETCGMSFKNQTYLNGHIKNLHSGSKYIFCEDCGQQIKRSAYRRHRESKHPATPRTRIPCKFCEKSCVSKKSMRVHLAIAHGEGTKVVLHCDQCPRKFASQVHMKRHMMSVHMGVKQSDNVNSNTNHTQSTALKENNSISASSNNVMPSAIINPSDIHNQQQMNEFLNI